MRIKDGLHPNGIMSVFVRSNSFPINQQFLCEFRVMEPFNFHNFSSFYDSKCNSKYDSKCDSKYNLIFLILRPQVKAV